MKFLIMAICLTLTASAALAQKVTSQTSDPPDVVIVQKSWREEVHQPSLEVDPFEANDRHREQVQAQTEAIRQNVRRPDQTVAVRVNERTPNTSRPMPGDASVTYVYRVKIKNGGAKTIKALVWEYVFTDQETQKEVGRHPYMSKVKINPSKEAEVVARSALPPSQVVDAARVGKDSHHHLDEKVVISHIDYADGSAWESRSQ